MSLASYWQRKGVKPAPPTITVVHYRYALHHVVEKFPDPHPTMCKTLDELHPTAARWMKNSPNKPRVMQLRRLKANERYCHRCFWWEIQIGGVELIKQDCNCDERQVET